MDKKIEEKNVHRSTFLCCCFSGREKRVVCVCLHVCRMCVLIWRLCAVDIHHEEKNQPEEVKKLNEEIRALQAKAEALGIHLPSASSPLFPSFPLDLLPSSVLIVVRLID